jgi:hypothetical protein
MTVWIVRGGWHYEGSQIIGVYASIARAQEVMRAEEEKMKWDYVKVSEWVVEE